MRTRNQPQRSTNSRPFNTVKTGLFQGSSLVPSQYENTSLNNKDGFATNQTEFADISPQIPNFGHDFSQIKVSPGRIPTIQTKLAIAQPNDKYEQEADRVADQLMRMPEPDSVASRITHPGQIPVVQRVCSQCEDNLQRQAEVTKDDEEEGQIIQAQENSGQAANVTPTLETQLNINKGSGQPLPEQTRTFMESRFKHDFSQVRIHTDARASESAEDLSALAYTLGNNIVFGKGQFAPNTREGRRLLAHELAHTVQQEQGIRRNVIQRFSGCSSAQNTTISADHARARTMLSNAIAAVSSYNGTSPTKVFNALSKHFNGSTSNAFATWINVNLRFLWAVTSMAGYECYTGGLLERVWACGSHDLATTFWCVPDVNIRLCPLYFSQSPTERSTTLIHEWVHKYGCNFDLGYEHEPDYSHNSTVSQLLNADSFSNFIRDVQ